MTSRSLFIPSILLILSLILVLSPSIVEAQKDRITAKCMPLPSFSGNFVQGYDSPVCANLLRNMGVTHFWVDIDDVPRKSDQEGIDKYIDYMNNECTIEAYYVLEAPVQRLLNVFTADTPSTICQSVLMTQYCLHAIPVCDPVADAVTYTTSDQNKPCNWLCNLFHDQVAANDICDAEDRKFLTGHNVDLSSTGIDKIPQFECTSSRYAPEGSEETLLPSGLPSCLSPQFISNEPQAARCESYSGSVCQSVFAGNTQVYIPAGSSQDAIEATLFNAAFVLNGLPMRDHSGCIEAVLGIYCKATFRECLNFGVKQYDRGTDGYPIASTEQSTPLPLPLNPPVELCERYVDECNDVPLFEFYRKTAMLGYLANCQDDHKFKSSSCIQSARGPSMTAATTYAFNQKSFIGPSAYDTMMFDGPDGKVYVGNIFASSQLNSVQYIPYTPTCTAPLVVAPEDTSPASTIFGTADMPSRCTWPCPTPVFTAKERDSIEIAAWVLIMFALVASGILALTFSVFHSQRHKHLLFWYVCTYFGVAFMLFLGLIVRPDGDLWSKQCSSETEYQHMAGFGLFQGIMLVYFLSASTCFWLMQAVDLFQRLILGLQFRRGSSEDFRRKVAMHLFSWFTPALVVGGIATAGQFGYDNYLPFAWITMDPKVTNNLSSRYSLSTLFFVQIVLCIAIGLILVGIVLVYLLRYSQTEGLKKFQGQLDDEKNNTWFKIQQTLRLFGFVFLVIPFFVIIIVRQIYMSARVDLWAESQLTWGQNLVLSLGGVNFFTLLPVEGIQARMTPPLVNATTFGLCSPGIIMFILYGLLSADIYGLWLGIFAFGCGIECFKRWAKEDTATGSDGSGRSSADSTGSNGSNRTAGVSNDIFGGGVVLVRGRSDNNNNSNTNSQGATSSHTVTKGSDSGTGLALPDNTPKKLVQNKATLFKGMTKGSNDHRASTVSGSQSDYGYDVEMSPVFTLDDGDSRLSRGVSPPPPRSNQAPVVIEEEEESEF